MERTGARALAAAVMAAALILNWFLNANMKLQLNYMAAHREAPQDVVSGWINGVGFRAAYDF